ncbi:MAG: glutaredoxin family protein [Cycloclasticus sp.]|nr:glutaredoxin family protein [Cycloclasticus sp.]
MTIELNFYTTDGCHLCDDAQKLLKQLLVDYPQCYQIEIIDIVESASLVEQYGTRIPVVADANRAHDLGWQFDYPTLISFAEGLVKSG